MIEQYTFTNRQEKQNKKTEQQAEIKEETKEQIQEQEHEDCKTQRTNMN